MVFWVVVPSSSLLSSKQGKESALLLGRPFCLVQTVLVKHHGKTSAALVCAGSRCVAVRYGSLFSFQPGRSGSDAGTGVAQVLVRAEAEELQSPRAAVALVWGSEAGTSAAKPQQA